MHRILTIAAVLAISGFSAMAATAADKAGITQSAATEYDSDKISKADARRITKEFLQSRDTYKKLKVGRVIKERGRWKVMIKTRNNAEILTSYIDDKTGEITFKQ